MERFNCEILTKKPADFDERWSKWLKEVHDVPNHIDIEYEVEEGYGKRIGFYYDSVKNTKIFAILYLRLDSDKPTVVYYHGHGSYIEEDHNIWHCMNLVAAGYSVVAIDMRFQGPRVKDPNHYDYTNYPSVCYNITDLENCYSKRLDQDALKIIDVIRDPKLFPNLKNRGLMVAGPSQGGGLSLMAASMSDAPIICSLSDVPSDCAIQDRALNKEGKYGAILDFVIDHPEVRAQVLANQDYFDVVNMTDRIKCGVICSIGTADPVCPPKYFMHAYNKIKGDKEIKIYEGYGHGGFEDQQLPLKIAFADQQYDKFMRKETK